MLTVTEKDTCLNTTNDFMDIRIDEFAGFNLIVPMNILKDIQNIKVSGQAYQNVLNNTINNLFEDKFIQKQFDIYKDYYYRELCEKNGIYVSHEGEEKTIKDYKKAILRHYLPFPQKKINALWNAFNFGMVEGITYGNEYYELVYNPIEDGIDNGEFKFKNATKELSLTLDDIVDLGLSVSLE